MGNLVVIEDAVLVRNDMERRVVKDCNGFVLEQVRFLPVNDWDVNDGWRTTKYLKCYKS